MCRLIVILLPTITVQLMTIYMTSHVTVVLYQAVGTHFLMTAAQIIMELL